MEEHMESNSFGPEEQMPQKDAFKKGVLAGVLGTAVAFLLIITASAGIFFGTGNRLLLAKDAEQYKTGLENQTALENGNRDGQEIGQENGGGISQESEASGDGPDSQGGSSAAGILNTDLMTEAVLINSYLQEHYLYDYDEDALRDGMLKGMIAALEDPYSTYFDEKELASFTDTTQGEYYGIGAVLTQELNTGIIRISKPYEGTPALEAGLLPGDILVSVDGLEVTGMDLSQVVTYIKGEEGTTTKLHIYRESEEEYLDIEVERRKVEVPTVTSEMLDNQIGYLTVSSFDAVTTEQFISSYEELSAQGMQGVIVDLRDNGGGYVDTVEDMLDYLLPEGEIFYAKDKKGEKSMIYNSDSEAALHIPMIVLVNENSASAAEIFAGNIKEFNVGRLVGTTTYGKGVMQQMFYTNADRTAAVKLTVGDYYIHNDININGVGISPDVPVELSEEAARKAVLSPEEDEQLQAAIQALMEDMQR